jgi:uncharacterized protein YjbI with pentapeptide repeats
MKQLAILIALVTLVISAGPVAAASPCPTDPTAEAAPGVDWSNCDLSSANLSGADLTGANLSGADLTGANLLFANLTSANLSAANLTGANAHARYLFANLSGANLSFADLSGAELVVANVSSADLTGANLMHARIEFSTFLGATGEPFSDAGAFYNNVTCPDGTLASFDLPKMSCWPPPEVTLSELSDAHLWLGLQNSDDQGTRFDVKVELFRFSDSSLIASGLTRCVTGLTRNPASAKEVVVPWDAFSPVSLNSGDVLVIVISTRIGTNSDDTKCSGPGGSHKNALGLRIYYDAASRVSRFDATIGHTNRYLFLHSDGGGCLKRPSSIVRTLNSSAPTGTLVQCEDSGHLNFAGGNQFSQVGDWGLLSGE